MCQFKLALHHKQRELLAQVGVRIVFQGVLSGDDASLVVVAAVCAVAKILTEVVVELSRVEFFLHQLVLQLEELLLSRSTVLAVGVEVHVLLKCSNGVHGLRLVETRLRCAVVEAHSDIELSLLCVYTFRITLEIFLECGSGSLVVFTVVFCHTQHIKALLSVLGAFLHCYQSLQQRRGAHILTVSITLFRILVFVCVVRSLVDSVEFVCATREDNRCKNCSI